MAPGAAVAAASSILDAVSLLVSAQPAGSAVQSGTGAALSAQAVSDALQTLDVCLSFIQNRPALLSVDVLSSVASSTTALLTGSSTSLSSANSSAALRLFAAVASSTTSTVAVASTVASGLASALGSGAGAADAALQLQGIGVIGSLATTLNAAPSTPAAAAAATGVRASLLNTLATSAGGPSVAAVADALIGSTALLLNTSSSGAYKSTTAPAVSLAASTVTRVLDALGGMVAALPGPLSPSSAANVAGSAAVLVANSTSLTPAGGSTALALFLAVATAPSAPMTMAVADSVAFGLSSVLDAPSINAHQNVTQSTQARAGELVGALSVSLMPLVAQQLPSPPPPQASQLPPAPYAEALRSAVPTVYFAITAYGDVLSAGLFADGGGGPLQAAVGAMTALTGNTSLVSVLSGEYTLNIALALAGVDASATSAAGLRPALLAALLPPSLSNSLALRVLGVASIPQANATAGRRMLLQSSADGADVAVLVATTDLGGLQQFNSSFVAAVSNGSVTFALQAAGVNTTGTELVGPTTAGAAAFCSRLPCRWLQHVARDRGGLACCCQLPEQHAAGQLELDRHGRAHLRCCHARPDRGHAIAAAAESAAAKPAAGAQKPAAAEAATAALAAAVAAVAAVASAAVAAVAERPSAASGNNCGSDSRSHRASKRIRSQHA